MNASSTKEATKAEMCRCEKEPALPEHSCPFKEEIGNDCTTLCNCCDECMGLADDR